MGELSGDGVPALQDKKVLEGLPPGMHCSAPLSCALRHSQTANCTVCAPRQL